MRELKRIPQFKNEQEEREFWLTHDSTEYIDWTKGSRVVFPNLKTSTESISLRLPSSLLWHIKNIANAKDVPYQSLIKIMLDEKVKEENKSRNLASNEYIIRDK
jgi:predicted DNA binding CopG/RHH family protein